MYYRIGNNRNETAYGLGKYLGGNILPTSVVRVEIMMVLFKLIFPIVFCVHKHTSKSNYLQICSHLS